MNTSKFLYLLVAFITLSINAIAGEGTTTEVERLRSCIAEVFKQKPLPSDCSYEAAVELLVEIAVVESGIVRNGRIVFVTDSNGYDYGPLQVNLSTAIDVLSRCDLEEIRRVGGFIGNPANRDEVREALINNWRFGAYVIRQKYGHQSFRCPETNQRESVWLGKATLQERADWWKKRYNTSLGAGSAEKYVRKIREVKKLLGS
jgi:hypothetical protein